ncbi:MAG TPA: IlvD/Edd family dehydratase [Gaiellales bacterium]|jgi:dihydroxy-acid dehydratase
MTLRSESWFGGSDLYSFVHRSWMRAEGFAKDVFDGRPVIGICNSWSELTSCNAHLRIVAEAVKRGVWEAGGWPLEFPTISLGEPFMKPTTMMYRNLMAMDVEESLRANPLDGVVLLCGCDKTTPAQLMGAASADLPAIMVTGGPMLKGNWRGQEIGSGTDAFRFNDLHRRGRITDEQLVEIESCMSRSSGHCMVMGTASTMTSIAEALGMTLPGSAAIPAVDSRRYEMAQRSGRRAVELAREGVRPSQIMTRAAFHNAMRVNAAIGGSTNAIVHLMALAGRLGVKLELDDFDEIARTTPWLANVKPSGDFLMEDFFYAGGVPAVMRELGDLLEQDAMTVSGQTAGQNVAGAETHVREVIRTREDPLRVQGGTVILRGNLAPNGAVLKVSAASEHLLQHTGRALVFHDRDDLLARIDDDDLEVDADTVLVLQNAGPKGGPGMPEWGQLPIPRKLLDQGVTDMVRISDARMSGTSYGTVVLHVAPESAIGGPLAAVRTGDEIRLDVPGRTLDVLLSEVEIAARLDQWSPPARMYSRGYGRLFAEHVLQADEGCDFDFLRGDGEPNVDVAARYARIGHS